MEHEVARIDRLKALEDPERRRELRRLAAAAREVIEVLTGTAAPDEVIRAEAAAMEEMAARLGSHPRERPYEGFAELANADLSGLSEEGAAERLRAKLWATFDHSPLIGLANPLSPPLELDTEGDRVVGRVRFGSAYEGPPGCVHGGFIAAVLDELLGSGQALSGATGMTARLEVDYRRPTPLHADLELVAWVEAREGRKIHVRGTVSAAGEVTAEGRGLFVAFDRDRFVRLLADRSGS